MSVTKTQLDRPHLILKIIVIVIGLVGAYQVWVMYRPSKPENSHKTIGPDSIDFTMTPTIQAIAPESFPSDAERNLLIEGHSQSFWKVTFNTADGCVAAYVAAPTEYGQPKFVIQTRSQGPQLEFAFRNPDWWKGVPLGTQSFAYSCM